MKFFDESPARKNFTDKTKKMEWMDAAGRNPYDYMIEKKWVATSYCRNCGAKLKWGERGYHFDHFDNNPANNKPENCYLACATCHDKATPIKRRPIKDYFGDVTGYKTTKLLVGYKKKKRRAGSRRTTQPKS